MVHLFGSLLERGQIKKDFNPNYQKIVNMMDDLLQDAKIIYDRHMEVSRQGRQIRTSQTRQAQNRVYKGGLLSHVLSDFQAELEPPMHIIK